MTITMTRIMMIARITRMMETTKMTRAAVKIMRTDQMMVIVRMTRMSKMMRMTMVYSIIQFFSQRMKKLTHNERNNLLMILPPIENYMGVPLVHHLTKTNIVKHVMVCSVFFTLFFM